MFEKIKRSNTFVLLFCPFHYPVPFSNPFPKNSTIPPEASHPHFPPQKKGNPTTSSRQAAPGEIPRNFLGANGIRGIAVRGCSARGRTRREMLSGNFPRFVFSLSRLGSRGRKDSPCGELGGVDAPRRAGWWGARSRWTCAPGASPAPGTCSRTPRGRRRSGTAPCTSATSRYKRKHQPNNEAENDSHF